MADSNEHKRIISLDAFRGAVIAGMILVNSPGTYRAIYAQLKHAEWNGWTFTDFIFPFFLFIVGVTTTLSIARRKERGDSDSMVELGILRRSLILFGLGLFMNTFPIFHLSTIRIPGVLQRIAVCYLATAFIVLKDGVKGRIWWAAGLLAFYSLLMKFGPVPGATAGTLEPGMNFAAYLDSLVLEGHMWPHYETWDPEGIFSTVPAIATTLIGALTGECLRSGLSDREKTVRMVVAGSVLLVLGLILNGWIPINKNIWTTSYCLFTGGLAVVSFAAFYWIIDVKGRRIWTKPFVILGANAITVYVLSETLDTTLRFIRFTVPSDRNYSIRSYVFRHYFEPATASLPNASLLFAIAYLLLMFLVAWFMWKKRWFIKI